MGTMVRHRRAALLPGAIIGLLLILAVLAPLIAPYAFDALDLAREPSAFGIDVDQSRERNQKFHLPHDCCCCSRLGFAGIQPSLRFGARKESDLIGEFRGAGTIALAAAGEHQRNAL
ncbi:MAG TPA: hypothetical protein VI259_01545, partial [Gemmatimonadaceae bacterium]